MKKLALVLLVASSFVACKSQKAATPTPTPTAAPAKTDVAAAATPEVAPTRSISDARAEPGATPFYFTREITKADLEGRSLRELNLMRNVIYARAGNPFRKKWLHEFFSAQKWYAPLAKMDESKLSALDRKNAETIAGYEVTLTGAELKRRRDSLLEGLTWAQQKRVETVAFSQDGTLLASGGASVEIWDVATGKRVKVVEASNEEWKDDGVALAFSDDAKQLAVVRKSGAVVIHDLGAGTSKEIVAAGSSNFFTNDSVYEDRASFARAPWRVAVANLRSEEDPSVTVHELPSGKPLTKISPLDAGETAFAPDGKSLVVYKDLAVQLVTPEIAGARKLLEGDDEVERVAISPDGKTFAAWVYGEDESWLLLQSIESGAPGKKIVLPREKWSQPERMAGRQPPVLAFAGNAAVLVESPKEKVLQRRAVPSGELAWSAGDLGSQLHLAVSPDGKTVAVGIERDHESRIVLLDAATGKPIPSWKGHEPVTPDELLELQLLSRAIGAEIPEIALRGMAADEARTPLDDVSQLDEHLKVDQLKDLSRRDLRLLRNAIYARRGRRFNSPVIREHFERMVWYKVDPAFTESRLTAVDLHNVKIVQSVENELGGPLTDAGHIEEEEWAIEESIEHPSFEGQRWYSGA